MSTRRIELLLLLAAAAAWAADDVAVVVRPIDCADEATAREMTAKVTSVFTGSPFFSVFAFDATQKNAVTARADISVVNASDGRMLVTENRLYSPSLTTVAGSASRDGTDWSARLSCTAPDGKVLGDASSRAKDAVSLAGNLAEQLHAQLTGNRGTDFERDRLLTTNDNSDVKLDVSLDRQPTGDCAVYYDGGKMRVRVRASEPGFVTVLAVGINGVDVLCPVFADMPGGIRAGSTLELPTPEYGIEHDGVRYDTEGFQLYGRDPDYERVFVFFTHQRLHDEMLGRILESYKGDQGQAGTVASPLSNTAFWKDYLPNRLRPLLFATDPRWKGASVRYYYAVSRDNAPPSQGVAAGGPRRGAAADKAEVVHLDSVVGAGPLTGTEPDAIKHARDLAMLDARRLALETGLGVKLDSQTLIEKFELIRDTIKLETQAGFVRLGPPLEERRDNGMYLYRCAADVSPAPFLRAVHDPNLPLRQALGDLSFPRVMLLFNESVDKQKSEASIAESAVRDWLVEAGFDLIDRQQLEALNQRDLVQQAFGGTKEQADQAAMQLAALLNVEIIIKGTAWAEADHNKVPEGQSRGACEATIERTVKSMIETAPGSDRGSLFDRLVNRWMSAPSVVTMKVQGITSDQADGYAEALQPGPAPRLTELARTVDMTNPDTYRPKVSLFSTVDVKSFSNGLAVIEARSDLRPKAAIKQLKDYLRKLGWSVTGMNGTLLDVKGNAKPTTFPALGRR